jgi:transposase
MTVRGIGPIVSSATVAAIGKGVAFARGRDFLAWLGLVPKQTSTGDRTILGRISKRGNGGRESHAAQRQEAIQRLSAGETQMDIARSFNVHHTTIGRLATASPFAHGAVGL